MIGAMALLLSFALTPLWQHLANRLGLTAQPGPRRVHTVPTPTGGGVVVYIALWGALFIGSGADGAGAAGWSAAASGAFLVLVGLLDDIYDLKPLAKLVGQVIAAVIFALSLPADLAETLFFNWPPVPAAVKVGLAVVWLVAMTNMFNIVDGLDGLAGGLAVVAATPLLALAALHGAAAPVWTAAALVGAVLGFLRYNIHPARLFMGDAGGMLVGFVVGIVSLQAMAATAHVSPAIVLLSVAVPLFDTMFAVVRRWSRGEPIAQGDAMHTHHQLLRHGLATRQAVLLLNGIGAVGAVLAFVVAGMAPWFGWAALALIGAVALPFARRIGVLGSAPEADSEVAPASAAAHLPRLVASSEAIDFRKETGKFRGIAK